MFVLINFDRSKCTLGVKLKSNEEREVDIWRAIGINIGEFYHISPPFSECLASHIVYIAENNDKMLELIMLVLSVVRILLTSVT